MQLGDTMQGVVSSIDIQQMLAALDDIQCAVYLKDTKGLYLWLNNACANMLGVSSPADAIGKTDFEFFSEKFAQRNMDRFAQVVNTGSSDERLDSIIYPEGELMWVIISEAVIMKHGGIRGVIGVIMDVNSIVEASRTSEEEKNTYEDLFENANEMIITTDTNGFITRLNRKASEIAGYTNVELLGKNIIEIAPREDKKHYFEIWRHVTQGKQYLREERILTKDGDIRQVLVSGRPVVKDGNLVALHFNAQDITDYRNLQRKLLPTAKAELIEGFAASIAHEFRNLTMVITGYSELVLKSLGPGSPVYDKVQQIYKTGEKALKLADNMLSFNESSDSGIRAIDVNEEISRLEFLLDKLVGENIKLSVGLGRAIPKIRINPSHLVQVVMNLVMNAKEAMPDGGDITVITNDVRIDKGNEHAYPGLKPGGYASITVKDTGKGLGGKVQREFMEPFLEQSKGTIGSGLSTVYSIIKDMGGDILVESEPNKGSSFTLFIPSIPEETEDKSRSSSMPSKQGETKTILVVEDDDTVRDLVVDILEEAGYDVLSARNGGDALLLARERKGKIDILITDIIMRRINGKMLSSKMLSIWPDIKVIYMSGYGDEIITEADLRDKAFLQKPFLPSELLGTVQRLLAQ